MKPISIWSKARFWFAFVVLLLLAAGCVIGICINDRALASTCTTKSAALEWVSSPSEASRIVHDWEVRQVVYVVTNGVLIDFAFIVFYSTLLAIVIFRCANAVPLVEWWSSIGDQLGWWMWIAGALDVLENVGILLELYGHAFNLAPTIAVVAIVKWIIVSIGVLYIAFTVVLWLRQRAAGRDPELQHELEELRLTANPQPRESRTS